LQRDQAILRVGQDGKTIGKIDEIVLVG
jgi:hypothetical protein